MTIAEMRDFLCLGIDVPDADVVYQYGQYLLGAQPADEPVTLAEARAQLGVSSDIDDALITGLIVAAREYAEGYTGLILTAREVAQTIDCFGRTVDLYAYPVREITGIEYVDASGAPASLDAAGYVSSLARRPVRLYASIASAWPMIASVPGGITITVQAGYASPEEVPQSVKQAMLLLIRHWYDNPSAVVTGGSGVSAAQVPLGTTVLLDRYRLRVV